MSFLCQFNENLRKNPEEGEGPSPPPSPLKGNDGIINVGVVESREWKRKLLFMNILSDIDDR